MVTLFGFPTQNTYKVLYVLEELGTPYRFEHVDLFRGEQRKEEFMARTPLGKVPLLEHGGRHLFESSAIVRYLANATGSDLYPDEPWARGQVDQWVDFFTCHLGRSLTTLAWERVVKAQAGRGEPNEDACAAAEKDATHLAGVVDAWLSDQGAFANEALSIADFYAFAYVEQSASVGFDLAPFPALEAWHDVMEARPAISRARAAASAADPGPPAR